MKFSVLNVVFRTQSLDPVDSRRPAHVCV